MPLPQQIDGRIDEEFQQDLQVVGESNDGRELFKYLKSKPAHLVLMDISMPELGGFEATLRIKKKYPEIKVLIVTIHKYNEYAERDRALVAEGYLLKEEVYEQLMSATSSLREGGTFISPRLSLRLREINQMRASGMGTAGSAHMLFRTSAGGCSP